MIKIVKYKKGMIIDDGCIYIGRKWALFPQSKWHNPYKSPRDGTREEVVEKYRQYLLSRNDLLDALPELIDKTLICWCGGRENGTLCHGDVLKEMVERKIEQSNLITIKKDYSQYIDDLLHGELTENRPEWCLCSGRLPHPSRCIQNKEKMDSK